LIRRHNLVENSFTSIEGLARFVTYEERISLFENFERPILDCLDSEELVIIPMLSRLMRNYQVNKVQHHGKSVAENRSYIVVNKARSESEDPVVLPVRELAFLFTES